MGSDANTQSIRWPKGEQAATNGFESSLDAIGTRHGTDKSSSHHGYLDFYERFFRDLRYKQITLLEIGVLRGESARMWNEYFEYGKIIGVDVNPEALQSQDDRIIIEIANQSNV